MATIYTTEYEVTDNGDGNYEVKQKEPEKPDLNSGGRQDFNFDFKIFSVSGYIDTDTQTIAVWPKVAGFQIGDGYSASFQSGIQIQIVLLAYNGSVRFNVEGNSLVMHLHLSPLLPWGDDVNYDGTIFSF